jgi:TrmH RNA methyltransferase
MSKKSQNEILIYGLHTIKMLVKTRQKDLIRLYCTQERIKDFGDLLSWCAKNGKAYHVVTTSELDKITHATHHQGIAALVKQKPLVSLENLIYELTTLKKNQERPLIYLDGVANSHNLGAITRSMAHFGAQFIIGLEGELPKPSASWIRLSSGGYEFIELIYAHKKTNLFHSLKKLGYKLVGLSGSSSNSLFQAEFPAKTVFILGNEITGLSKEVKEEADSLLKIPGSGSVESLNVSVAAGVCLGEWWRRYGSN